MTATLTRTVLAVDGIRSPMLQAGPPQATEAVVFVHGNPGSSQDWARLLQRTGALARAVAWDHPGFGQADTPAGFDHTVPGYATHLGRCLDALGITWAHLVLHDFGGPWGWPGRPPTPTASPAPPCSTSASCPATAGTPWPGSGAPRYSASWSTPPPPGPGSGCCCATATPAGSPSRSSTACTPTWMVAPSGPSWPCTGPPTTRPAPASGSARRCGPSIVRPW
jgi:alpha/beta hydrolase fold